MRSTSPASGLLTGESIIVARDWKKTDTQEAAFLHARESGRLRGFTTVLGPGADVFHYNHFHLDLAMHGDLDWPAPYCRPDPPPDLQRPPRRRRLAAGPRR